MALAAVPLPFLFLLLLLFINSLDGATITTDLRRGLRKKQQPPQSPPSHGPELTLTSCYEPALNGTNGSRPPFFEGRFSAESFPFCQVLTPGRAVLYWTWRNESSSGAWTGPDTSSSSSSSNASTTTTPVLPSDAANVTLTLGVLLRRNLSSSSSSSSWAALGLSEESEGMPGMDVAMLRGPDENGAFNLSDRFATWYALPELDQTQNKELLYASRAFPPAASVLNTKKKESGDGGGGGGVPVTTAFIFSMPAAANCEDGHHQDVSIVPGRSTFMMWAQGDDDLAAMETGPAYHGPGDRGAAVVGDLLLPSREALARSVAPVAVPVGGDGNGKKGKNGKKAEADGEDGNDAPRTLRVALPGGVEVPARRTTYMCMYAEVPQDRKFHIYQTRYLYNGSAASASDAGDGPSSSSPAAAAGGGGGVESPGGRGLVHHAILYAVMQNETAPGHVALGQPYDCTNQLPISRGLPYLVASHRSLTSPSDQLWAAVDAALPLGKGYGKYVVLEVHFDNPSGRAGQQDGGTGFELVLSPRLRSQDAGTLLLGSIPTTPETNTTSPLAIPPGRPRFDFVDYCPSTCTKTIVPASPSTAAANPSLPGRAHVLFARLHMHMLGLGGELQLLHNTSLDDDGGDGGRIVRRRLLKRDYWDFNNQQGVAFAAPGVPFRAGDGFLTRCTYSSLGRRNATTWGERAEDEMCLGYVFYYPAVAPTACFDLTGARQPAFDAWTRFNKGKPLHVASCLRLPEFSAAAAAAAAGGPQQQENNTASSAFSRLVAERGMVVETPGPERRFTRAGEWSVDEKIGNVTTTAAVGGGAKRGGQQQRDEGDEGVVWDPVCRAARV